MSETEEAAKRIMACSLNKDEHLVASAYLSQTERVKALEHLLEKCKGPLEYAYWNVSSVTSRKVKDEILPAIRAALQGTGT